MDPQVTPLEPLVTSSLSVEKWLMTTPYCTVLDRPLDRGGGEGLQKNYFFGLKRRGEGWPPLAPLLDLPLLQGEEIYCTVLK